MKDRLRICHDIKGKQSCFILLVPYPNILVSNSLPFPLSFTTNALDLTAADTSDLAVELQGASICCVENLAVWAKSDLASA